MKYPQHVLKKIMANPKLKKRYEKEQNDLEAKAAKPAKENGDKK